MQENFGLKIDADPDAVDLLLEDQENNLNFEDTQKKDMTEFMALVEKIDAIENDEERIAYIKTLIEKTLVFFDENAHREGFLLSTRKLEYLSMCSDQHSFDRAWSQEQVDKIFALMCENQKDAAWEPSPFFSSSVFLTDNKEPGEIGTVSDQFAKAVTDRLNRGESIEGWVGSNLNVWLQDIQMIDVDTRLDLICAVLNNPAHISRATIYTLVAEQAGNGGYLIEQLTEKINSKEIHVILRILDILQSATYLGQMEKWMSSGGATALEKIQEMSDSNQNYFVKLRLETILANLYSPKNEDGLDQYADLNSYRSKIKPLEAKFYYDQAQVVESSNYSAISDKYGVIYNPSGRVDSFFSLEQSEDLSNLELADILSLEAVDTIHLTEEEKIDLINNYRAMISPVIRHQVEDFFGIQLKDFDIRTQMQFVNFISSKTTEEVEVVKNFLNQGLSAEAKLNRIKLFLSMEFGKDMGAKILSLGENLHEQAETADVLFAEYAKMAEDSELITREVCVIYNKIFPDKQIEELKILQAILKRGHTLLNEAEEALGNETDEQKKEQIVSQLRAGLLAEKEVQNFMLTEFKDLSQEIQDRYGDKEKEGDLLKYQDLLETKLEQVLVGEFDVVTDKLLLEKYKEIQQSIANSSQVISEYFGDLERHVRPEEIAEELFAEALKIISTPTASIEDKKTALQKLDSINADVLLTAKIVKQLPREEVARLDLKKISPIEKLLDISGPDLLSRPDVLEQIRQLIIDRFPKKNEDAEDFETKCAESSDFRVTITLANDRVMSSFAKERMTERFDYLDWFISNPDAPIKGLGEATLNLGLDSESAGDKSYYAVAKPHVKSFQIVIENLGFVAFGITDQSDGYAHHYARTRRFSEDQKFATKNLPEDKKDLLWQLLEQECKDRDTVQEVDFAGNKIRICRVDYHGQTADDDIQKDDQDGWLMAEIEKQQADSFVLTRFISQTNEKNNQSYYVVFERDSAPADLRGDLLAAISSHVDSKKILSS